MFLLGGGIFGLAAFGAVGEVDVTTYVVKAATTTRNSTTTLADDPDLLFTGIAAGRYALFGFLNVISGATPDFKLAWRCDNVGADTSFVQTMGVDATTGTIGGCFLNAFAASPGSSAFVMSGNQYGIWISGIVIPTASAAIALMWAQNTSDAGNTSVRAGSWLGLTLLP